MIKINPKQSGQHIAMYSFLKFENVLDWKKEEDEDWLQININGYLLS